MSGIHRRMRYAYPTCLSCKVFLKFSLLNESRFLPEGFYGTLFTLRFILVGCAALIRPTSCLSLAYFLSAGFPTVITGVFFTGAFLALAFLTGAFFAGACLASTFISGVFISVAHFTGGVFDSVFILGAFFAGAFFFAAFFSALAAGAVFFATACATGSAAPCLLNCRFMARTSRRSS